MTASGEAAAGEPAFVHPTWCEIERGAIEHNVRLLRDVLGEGVQIYVCLKGDASGCGAVEVALASERSGAHGFTFGNVDAAIACRRAGVSLPILLYPSCLPSDAPTLAHYSLSPTLSTLDDVAQWDIHAPTAQRLPVFLKIDTGGFRAGAFPDEAAGVAMAIAKSRRLELAGVYGHSFFGYGVENPEGVSQHMLAFRKAMAAIDETGIAINLRMCSSSELVLNHPEADFNAVDPGRLICGIGFTSSGDRTREWKPALVALKSRLVMRKELTHVGSVRPPPFVVDRPGLVLGLVPYGWSGGHARKLAPDAHVLVRGKRAPVIGPVHSELLRIDLTDIPEAEVGDEVVFLGTSGSAQIDLEQLAAQWNTDVFDVFCRIGKSVPRVYLST